MKTYNCDFCNKEIEEVNRFQFVDWTKHQVDLDLCRNCYIKFVKIINKLKDKKD